MRVMSVAQSDVDARSIDAMWPDGAAPGTPGGVSVDISIQPRLNFGRFTVMALRSYLIVDPRVKDLVLVIKTWSKRRRINEAFQGTLNSFSLILMVIHVLQNVEPPVLPNIFRPTLPLRNATSPTSSSSHKHIYLGARKPLAAIDGVDGRRKIVSFHRDEEALRGWGAQNKDPLSVLLLRFFCYYATEYDWASDCVSIVHGRVIKVGQNARFRRAYCTRAHTHVRPDASVRTCIDRWGDTCSDASMRTCRRPRPTLPLRGAYTSRTAWITRTMWHVQWMPQVGGGSVRSL